MDTIIYDKGAKALRCILPNGNHLYMPCFLAPAQGKTTFTGEEATGNKAIARCRVPIYRRDHVHTREGLATPCW